MAIKRPDIYEHNNPNLPIADSDFVKGGIRSAVQNLSDLYALTNKSEQLKQHSTQIYVSGENKIYLLKDVNNIGNSNGWEEFNFGGGSESLTNVVYTTGDQNITGIKTFQSEIVGSRDFKFVMPLINLGPSPAQGLKLIGGNFTGSQYFGEHIFISGGRGNNIGGSIVLQGGKGAVLSGEVAGFGDYFRFNGIPIIDQFGRVIAPDVLTNRNDIIVNRNIFRILNTGRGNIFGGEIVLSGGSSTGVGIPPNAGGPIRFIGGSGGLGLSGFFDFLGESIIFNGNKFLVQKEGDITCRSLYASTGNSVPLNSGEIKCLSFSCVERPFVNGTGVLLSGEVVQLPNTIVYTTGDQTISGNKQFSGVVISPFLTTRLPSIPKSPSFIFLTGAGGTITGTRHGIPFTNSSQDQEALSNFINSQSWVVSGRNGFSGPYSLLTPNLINTTGFVDIPLASGNNFVYSFTTFNVDDKFKKIERSGIFALLSGEKVGIGTIVPEEKLHVLGNLKLDGQLRTFQRPIVNGTGVLLSGEVVQLPNTIVYTTGDQTISGIKTFETGVMAPFLLSKFLGGFKIDLDNSYLGKSIAVFPDTHQSLNWGTKELSGQWKTNQRLLVNNTGVLLSGEAVNPLVDINNITQNFIFDMSFNTKLLTINSSQNITGTVPTGLQTGYNVSFVQIGNGKLFITGSGGSIIRQRLNLYNTAGQYAIASLLHHSGDQFILYGDLI